MAIRSGRLGYVISSVLGLILCGQFVLGQAKAPTSTEHLTPRRVFTHGKKFVITLEARHFTFTPAHSAFATYRSKDVSFRWDHHPSVSPIVHQGGRRITLFLVANSQNPESKKDASLRDGTGDLTISIFQNDPSTILIRSRDLEDLVEVPDYDPCP